MTVWYATLERDSKEWEPYRYWVVVTQCRTPSGRKLVLREQATWSLTRALKVWAKRVLWALKATITHNLEDK